MQRGTSKRTLSVVVTEDEWRTIQKLANHENFRALYNGHQSDLVRHAIYYMICDLEPYVEGGDLQHVVRQLLDHLRHDSVVSTKELIIQLLDTKADSLNDLLDFDETDGALDEYDLFLDKIAQLQPHWRRVVNIMSRQHPEMERWLRRMESKGLETTMALREISEKVR